jgi:MFS family permease
MAQIPLYIAPILSNILLVLGSGVSTTMTTIGMDLSEASSFAIAMVGSAFFVGIAVGSYQCQRFIFQITHIRAYAAFGSLLVAATVSQGLWYNEYSWMFLRFIIGYCLAGMYIVIESWLLGLSNEATRGRVLAIYMGTFYAAQATSQWLLEVPYNTFLVIFALIALFSALSMVPLAVTRYKAPMPESPEIISILLLWKRTSLGLVGCVASGLILSVIYSLLPKFMVDIGYVNYVAMAMFLVILGGTLLQFPIGKLSDHFDRRKVLVGICLACILCALGFMMFYQNLTLVLLFCFLLGGATFVIYPVSISHSIDFVESHRIVSAAAVLYISYGIGSAVGPVLTVPFINMSATRGYFIYIIMCSVLLAGFTVYRIIRLPVVVRGAANQFVSMPQTSPEAQQLDPRAQEWQQLSFDFGVPQAQEN